MDDARRRQLAIFAAWTPQQRLAAQAKMTRLVLALREERLRRTHPNADEAELRRLRVAEALLFSPSQRLP